MAFNHANQVNDAREHLWKRVYRGRVELCARHLQHREELKVALSLNDFFFKRCHEKEKKVVIYV